MNAKSIWRGSLVTVVATFLTVSCNNRSSDPSPTPPAPPAAAPPPATIPPTGPASAASVACQTAEDFNGQQLDPYTALQPCGSWFTLGGQRYFQPHLSNDPNGANWQPYQNGSWSYDLNDGWTWVSNDSWGWLTDHYGLWRHHPQHGWVWMPLPNLQYQPNCVTWFNQELNQNNYVGWYPYNEQFATYYVSTQNLGFDDGFWDRDHTVAHIGLRTGGFNFGITLVDRADVTRPDVAKFRVHEAGVIAQVAIAAHTPENIRQGLVGHHPGGQLQGSLQFITDHAKVQPEMGETKNITAKGGAVIKQFAKVTSLSQPQIIEAPAKAKAKQPPSQDLPKQETVKVDPTAAVHKGTTPKKAKPLHPAVTTPPEPADQTAAVDKGAVKPTIKAKVVATPADTAASDKNAVLDPIPQGEPAVDPLTKSDSTSGTAKKQKKPKAKPLAKKPAAAPVTQDSSIPSGGGD